jgi:PPM family protein phosphatase
MGYFCPHLCLSRTDLSNLANVTCKHRTMSRLSIEAIGLTDVGRVRQYNEDSIVCDTPRGLMAVADGMGGHRAGEVASRMATDSLLTTFREQIAAMGSDDDPISLQPAVEQSIIRANDEIMTAARSNPACFGMGTTLAVALFHGCQVTLAHVGDSRIYLLRYNRLQLLTRDDSLLRDQVELGLISAAAAAGSHNRNLVTRALGVETAVQPHLHEDKVLAGDVYLLCSDGLNDLVDDSDIELIVNSLKANLPLAAQHLIQAAKDNGGHDNVSAILVSVRGEAPAGSDSGWLQRLLAWLRPGTGG